MRSNYESHYSGFLFTHESCRKSAERPDMSYWTRTCYHKEMATNDKFLPQPGTEQRRKWEVFIDDIDQFLNERDLYSVVCSSKWSSSWLLSISILHHDQRLGVDWQLSNLNAIETTWRMFLTDKIWTFASNPDKNEEFSSQCLSKSPKRLQLPNVCLKIKSQNKNSCRPAAAADKCGWIFRRNPFSKYPSQKLTFTQERIFSISTGSFTILFKKGRVSTYGTGPKTSRKGINFGRQLIGYRLPKILVTSNSRQTGQNSC